MDDLAVPQHHRAGAHRARRHPLLSTFGWLASVALFAGLVVWGLLATDILGSGGLSAGTIGATVGVGASAEPTASAAAPAVTAPPAAAVPEPVPAPSVVPTAAAEPSPEVVVDRGVEVVVLNSTSTSGLAAGAAAALEDAGWTVGEVTNYDGDEMPTVVLFSTPDLAATAAAVAADLGIGRARSDDAQADGAVTVVLGPDYDN